MDSDARSICPISSGADDISASNIAICLGLFSYANRRIISLNSISALPEALSALSNFS